MAGRSIYFTEKELDMLRNYVFDAIEILGEAEGTCERTVRDLENGLGSAMYKLYKGRNGARNYERYIKKG